MPSVARSEPTIAINGMAHVVVTVSDYAKARAFFARLLPACGMKPVFDRPPPTGCGSPGRRRHRRARVLPGR